MADPEGETSGGNQAAYRRGVDAGQIEARLRSHDAHFEHINGSIDRTGDAIRGLTLAVQRLSDQAIARDATVITTALALKEAEAVRRDRSTQSWSTFQKLLAVVAGAATVVGIIVALRSLFK